MMLIQRETNKSVHDFVRFGWAESSPQGGHNWLWMQGVSVPRAELVRTWRAVMAITDMAVGEARQWEGAGEDGDDDVVEHDPLDAPVRVARPAWLPHLEVIHKNVLEHIHPPVDLTSGFGPPLPQSRGLQLVLCFGDGRT